MITIERFTEDRIDDLLEFERKLRKQEPNTYYWEADEQYADALRASFHDPRFVNAVSLLAYKDEKVIGRIDASIISSRCDAACCSAYLDWICVLKNERHCRAAQKLLAALKEELKQRKVETLIAVMAKNEEAQRFYRSIENGSIHDEAIWIETVR